MRRRSSIAYSVGSIAGRRVERVAVAGVEDARHEGLHVAAVVHDRVGQRHGEMGAAVEGVLEGDDARAPQGALGELDGVLDGLGAGVGKQHLVEVARHDLAERVGEVEHGLVQVHVHLRVDHLAHLILRGLDDLGMAMAGVGHRDAHAEVEPLAAVGAVDPGALAMVDGDGRRVSDEAGNAGLLVFSDHRHGYLRTWTAFRFGQTEEPYWPDETDGHGRRRCADTPGSSNILAPRRRDDTAVAGRTV